MISRRSNRGPLAWLISGAGIVMALVIYAEIRARPMIEDESSPQATGTEIRVAPRPAVRRPMPEKTTFAAIIERPLFSPSRRPRSEETPIAPTPILDFSLLGVVISTGEPLALVKPGAGGEPVRVKEGEGISGWTVSRIESDRILVRHGGMERELRLDFAAPAPPAPELALPDDAQSDGKAGALANEHSAGENDGQPGEADEPVPSPEAEELEPADQNSAN